MTETTLCQARQNTRWLPLSGSRPSTALIAWGTRDYFFPVRDAERLARTLPRARLELIHDARTYVQIDQPVDWQH